MTGSCLICVLRWSDPYNDILNLSFVYAELFLEATAQTLLNSTVKCFYNLFLCLNFIRPILGEQWLRLLSLYMVSFNWNIQKGFCPSVSVYLDQIPTWIPSTCNTLQLHGFANSVAFLDFDGHTPICFWAGLTVPWGYLLQNQLEVQAPD